MFDRPQPLDMQKLNISVRYNNTVITVITVLDEKRYRKVLFRDLKYILLYILILQYAQPWSRTHGLFINGKYLLIRNSMYLLHVLLLLLLSYVLLRVNYENIAFLKYNVLRRNTVKLGTNVVTFLIERIPFLNKYFMGQFHVFSDSLVLFYYLKVKF